jgi:hypothetical protein
MNLVSQEIYGGKAIFGWPAEPVLNVLLDFRRSIQPLFVDGFANHKINYTSAVSLAKNKKSPAEDRLLQFKNS